MVIGVDNEITASDINAIITKINSEENARTTNRTTAPTTLTDLSSLNIGDFINANTPSTSHDDMRVRNDDIDALHCYCESDGAIETHQGGQTLVQTAPDVATGEQIDETGTADFSSLNTDVDAMIAQCDCNSNVCTCVTQSVLCDCNFYCSCNENCTCHFQKNGTVCSGYCVNCTCQANCSCDVDCTCDTVCPCEWG